MREESLTKHANLFKKYLAKRKLAMTFSEWKSFSTIMRKAKQYSRKEIKFKSLAIELEKEVKKIERESLEQAKHLN